MFWGLKLEGGKHYSQLVEKPFHISHATLAVHADKQNFADTTVAVHAIVEKTDYILCYLGTTSTGSLKSKTLNVQQPLNLEVSEGEEIVLYASDVPDVEASDCTVYLTGYFNEDISSPLQWDDEDDLEEDLEEDDEEILSSQEELTNGISTTRMLLEGSLSSGSESDEDYSLNGDEERHLPVTIEELPDSEEGEAPKPRKKRARKESKISVEQNGSCNGVDSSMQPPVTKKKKKAKKTAKNDEVTKCEESTKKTGPKNVSFKTTGGTEVSEILVGTGKVAKSGKKVFVKYTGRLEHNNRVFDSNIDRHQAFMFRLGQGEVVKGWDEGIKGMRVGGKRKLLLPPSQGYGSSGAPPKIPPNSKLLFQVELTNVK